MSNDNRLFQVEAVSKVFVLSAGAWQRRRNMLHAIREVTLEIYKGEVFGIIGESGSGKSTLGLALADIAAPTSGTIRFRGKAIDAMNREERNRFRQNVQVVFQDSASALNPRRRVGAILRDSLRLRGVPRQLRADAVERLLVDVGLSVEHVGRYPHQLSGGQRQRVGIARALAMEPEVIIADEPVSALDVSLQGQIINLLLDLQRRLNITIVLISHDIAVVSHVCQRVAVMNEGQIVEMGTADEVIQNPRNEYTRQLIAAVPKGIDRKRARKSIAYPELTGDECGPRIGDNILPR